LAIAALADLTIAALADRECETGDIGT